MAGGRITGQPMMLLSNGSAGTLRADREGPLGVCPCPKRALPIMAQQEHARESGRCAFVRDSRKPVAAGRGGAQHWRRDIRTGRCACGRDSAGGPTDIIAASWRNGFPTVSAPAVLWSRTSGPARGRQHRSPAKSRAVHSRRLHHHGDSYGRFGEPQPSTPRCRMMRSRILPP